MKFYDILKKEGIGVTIRKEHGTDIDAACGQLRIKEMKREKALQKLQGSPEETEQKD